MTDWMLDPQLSASLDAWRQSSRRAPRRHARERAHDAMLEAVATAWRPRARRSILHLRPRFGSAGLIASAATIAAAVGVAAAGWNAPAGSALFVVREARQGVQLKLPGSNDIVLHLQFAEQSLADARARINPAESLASAGTELDEAYVELSGNPSSPLWSRYHLDEATLLSDESELAPATRPPASTSTREPAENDTPGASEPAQGGGGEEETPRPTSAGTSPSPSPTRDDDGGGGDDPTPSPGQSPPPDN
jgi:hypothetical protein